MQIVFPDAFAHCLSTFMEESPKLEGISRPMEILAADFLRYLIELTLRKFLRMIRSTKSTALPDFPLQTLEHCAAFMTALFAKLLIDLSDPTTTMRQEVYYCFRMARRSETAVTVTPIKAKPRGEKPKEEARAARLKPCSGHL